MKKLFILIVLFISIFVYADDDYSSLFSDNTTDATNTTSTKTETSQSEKTYDFSLDIFGNNYFSFHIPVVKSLGFILSVGLIPSASPQL